MGDDRACRVAAQGPGWIEIHKDGRTDHRETEAMEKQDRSLSCKALALMGGAGKGRS